MTEQGSTNRSRLSLTILITGLLACTGCALFGPNTFLADRDSDIKAATLALESARNDTQRAKAYSARGTAYSEKARWGRIQKQTPNDEYERLVDLAIKDHDQAVALDPNNPEVYFKRAEAKYDRGSSDFIFATEIWLVPPTTKTWLLAAASDFEKAIELNPKNELAFDRLGLAYEEAGEEDKAIKAYTAEVAFNSFGKQRLADAYCFFGFRHQQQKEYPAAAEAFRKSVEWGTADDKSCPYSPLENGIGIYTTETREYDKAWEMVHQALKAGRIVSPERMQQLVKASGRTN